MATYYSQGTGNWSTLENWNDVANGSGNSPASIAAMDNNAFVIQAGHTITFDVEDAVTCDGSISGWAIGIAGITITGATAGNTPGELTLSSVANSVDRIYGLRLKDGMYIQGTDATIKGKLTAGSEETPIPANSRTIIQMDDPSLTSPYTIIRGTYLVIELYGTGPIEPVYELTSAALATDTQLHVRGLRDHTNPNTETEWRAGDTVIICNINKGVSRVVSTLDSSTPVGDGVINLSSPIGSTRLQGALVCLLNRNIIIRISGSPASSAYCLYNANNAILDSISIYAYVANTLGIIGYSNTFKIQGTSIIYSYRYCFFVCGSYFNLCDKSVYIANSAIISNSSNWYILDEVVCCGSDQLITTTSSGIAAMRFEISGDVIIAGNNYGIGGTNYSLGIVKGNVKIYGCNYGIGYIYTGNITNVKIYQCARGISNCSNLNVYGCELGIDSTNTYDIYGSGCKLYNTKLGSAIPVAAYATKYRDDWMYNSVISLNHNNVKSKYPTAWMPGGTVTPNLSYSPMPDGHTEICKMNFLQPSGMIEGTYNHNWVDIPILIQAKDIIAIHLWMIKDTNNMGIIPQAVLLEYAGDPWLMAPIDSYTMIDNINEQTDILVYDNSFSTINKMIFLRVFGGHTSGTLYWAYNINKWNANRMNGWIS